MHDLLGRETQDGRVAEAAALFCNQVKKWVGALAAASDRMRTDLRWAGIPWDRIKRKAKCE
jgi:acetate kinase